MKTFLNLIFQYLVNIYLGIKNDNVFSQNLGTKIIFKEWADARGKEGGRVFSKNKTGNYSKRKTTGTNPNSPAQAAVRASLTYLSNRWRALTQVQRDGWSSLANQISTTNIFGDAFKYTGMNVYVKLNRNLASIGEAYIETAPSAGAATGILITDLDADTTGGGLDVSLSAAVPVGSALTLSASKAQSAGVTTPKGGYRRIQIIQNADGAAVDVSAAYIAAYGALPPVGQKVFVRGHVVVKASGFASQDTVEFDTAS